MDSVDLASLIEQLDDNIDDLEDALAPLTKAILSDTAGKLPLLDKAQLYVLITYAIESIIFSFLRLNGINAKEHPVFRELTRVKLYFDKINNVESDNSKRETTLNVPAAGRFINHALAGNDTHDLKRAQQQVGEKARAHVKFEHLSNKRKRGNDQASVPNSNYQLIGALSSQSSSSPAIANAAVIRPADPATSALAGSVGGSPAIVILEKEHSGTRIVLPTTRESRSSKRRKRAKATKIPALKVCP
ncbi:MAG: hypothetical protein HETSPECPRED_007773 [Heterodermia speciosa]|uniref:Exosome complex protein n=1 Tax=Heterodermia speciosa TaxID=116794 RepID=A0A8H3FVW0_9LECA|nr:MAG: hypothetical protein HETSPECPRED_007773 [Heterodermia speciosa]